jgi:arabinose-5-phosphate isomerase
MTKDLKIAKKTIQTEIEGLKKLLKSFNRSSQFSKAVNVISKAKGKVIVIGTGKSFIIGNKISSTLSSLGTPSVAFDSSSLNHGSMGSIQKGLDILLIFSVSGETSELNSILRFSNRNNIPVVGVSCKSSSMLLRFSSIPILLPRVNEAGASLAPTTSQINFLSFGDALAISLSNRKKFSNKQFVKLHPHGQLGSALILVKEIMAKGKAIPLVGINATMKKAINEMSKKRLGIVCCKDKNGKISILTDGDLRRHSNNLFNKTISKVVSKNPTWVSDNSTALSAIEKMNSLKITALLVTNKKNINKKIKNIVGVIHLHHCLSQGIK